MVSRTMSRFDLHRKHPSACLHAVGPDASSIKTLLLSLSTIAGTKISNPPWVNFQSAGWVSFQSAPTHTDHRAKHQLNNEKVFELDSP